MAKYLNGSTQYYECFRSPIKSYPFTMSVWALGGSTTDADLSIGRSGYNNRAQLLTAATYPELQTVNAAASFPTLDSNKAKSGSVWYHHAGIVRSANYRSLWHDGQYQAQNTGTYDVEPETFDYVGIGMRRNSTGVGLNWLGSLAHVAFWNVELTAGELMALYMGASPMSIRRDALAAYWPLDGDGDKQRSLVGDDDLSAYPVGTPVREGFVPYVQAARFSSLRVRRLGRRHTRIHTMRLSAPRSMRLRRPVRSPTRTTLPLAPPMSSPQHS